MEAATNTIVEETVRSMLRFLSRHIGYLLHYSTHTRNLGVEAGKLKVEAEIVEGRVNRARNNAEEVEPNVSQWLQEVQTLLNVVEKLLEDTDNTKCCYGWCPDICACHRLGQKAENKSADVAKLREDGKFEAVAHRIPLVDVCFTSITDYQHFGSRDLAFQNILRALKDDESYIIGIYGMPGIGKTTMVEEIAKQAKHSKIFDEVAMAVISHDPDIIKIQGELADCLNLTLDRESRFGRGGLLRNRLRNGKKILVIIDDVWDEINLNEIGIPISDMIDGCKIMLTTRNENVCSQMAVQKEFQIGVLWEQEAQSLFKEKVGDSIDTSQNVANEVCRECGGLPLAIVALGAALRNKSKHVWDDALEQLRSFRGNNIYGMTAKVYIPIELSFRYLEHEDLRSCFLHCSLFPEDAEISIDDLMRYGLSTRFLQGMDTMKHARDRVQSLVQTLKTSCLLLEGRDENFIKMHDVIRDVAISIAANEKEHMFLVKTGVLYWPDEAESKFWGAISLRSKNIVELPSDLKYPQLRTLMLECNNPSLKVPNNFFKGMAKLEVLDLHDMDISSLWSSIPDLPNLRMLCLHRCNLTNLAFLSKLAKLEILSLNGSYIDEVDAEVGKLTRLRILDLKNCVTLITFPSGLISNLSRLEELYISDSFDEWEVEGSASLAELCSLPCLSNLEIHVPDHVIMPPLSFERLSRFKISVGHRLEKQENLQGTRILKLVGISLKQDLNVLIEKAEALYLTEVKGLKILFHHSDGGKFLDLKWLAVENCNGMDYLFSHQNWNSQTQQLGPFAKLSVLKVCNCRLKYVFSPSTARCLQQLRELHISQCFRLKEVIGDTEETGDIVVLPQLEYIVLDGVPDFRSIYADATTTSSSTMEWECSPSTLPQPLFNQKVSLPGLKKLLGSMTEQGMDGVVTDFGSDRKMENLINLTSLQIVGLRSLSLFSSSVAKNLVHLRQLEVSYCREMEAVIAVETDDESITFPQLETINFEGLPKFKAFCCSFESETIANTVPVFFNGKISFPALKELEIGGMAGTCVLSLWREAEGLRHLRKLVLSRLDSLVSLAPSTVLQTLDNLVELCVLDCSSMVCIAEVPEDNDDDILVFPRLKSLTLRGMHKLKSFCSTLHFKAKTKAAETDVTQVAAALFNHKVKFPSLEVLKIKSLKGIKKIWDNSVSADSFCKLKELTVDDCGKLLNVASFNLLENFQNLEQLQIKGCKSLKQKFKVAMFPQLRKLTLE